MHEDNPYDLLAADTDEHHRWAFGTGFSSPLDGVDTALPTGVDAAALAAYCRMLGDDALIYSHRLQQWVARLPELEEETAVANIALDLLGQARLLLTRAASADPSLGEDEDRLAFFRESHQFLNVRLVEPDDVDFADLVARLLVFATWRLAVFELLRGSADTVLAAIAAKGVHELAYHRGYAAEWVVRLGDGTTCSARRMQASLERVWPLVDELFATHEVERALPGVAFDPGGTRAEFDSVIDGVLTAGRLIRPAAGAMATIRGRAGRDGVHTEALSYVLAEMQSVARAHDGGTW